MQQRHAIQRRKPSDDNVMPSNVCVSNCGEWDVEWDGALYEALVHNFRSVDAYDHIFVFIDVRTILWSYFIPSLENVKMLESHRRLILTLIAQTNVEGDKHWSSNAIVWWQCRRCMIWSFLFISHLFSMAVLERDCKYNVFFTRLWLYIRAWLFDNIWCNSIRGTVCSYYL